jgi:CTP synthase (UTP-ammonia lyase)
VTVRIALIGDENHAYASHRELNAVRGQLGTDVESTWLATDRPEAGQLDRFDGIWLVPGSPYASDAAAYDAVTYARERDVPFLGTCSGMQYAVIEYTRNVLGDATASHAESDGPDASNVVVPLSCGLFGSEREVRPVVGSRFGELVGNRPFLGRHYCNYAPSAGALRRAAEAGLSVQATADDAGAEVVELPANRFFFASLFQPQIGALANRPVHPLLTEFLRCTRERT